MSPEPMPATTPIQGRGGFTWQASWLAPSGEALMLTLLIASRFDLADEPQAAAAEVFGLALTLCPPDRLVTKHWWKALMHSKQMGDVSRRVRHLVSKTSSICERNENNRVTRVVNLSCFCHSQGRVTSGDKLSHNTGLGFPLL